MKKYPLIFLICVLAVSISISGCINTETKTNNSISNQSDDQQSSSSSSKSTSTKSSTSSSSSKSTNSNKKVCTECGGTGICWGCDGKGEVVENGGEAGVQDGIASADEQVCGVSIRRVLHRGKRSAHQP